MKLKRATVFLWVLVSVLSHSAEQSVYDGIKAKHGIKPSDYALPAGAIELTTTNIFPSDHDEENGIYMPHPIELKGSSDGILYITDQRSNEIFCFDLAGHYLGVIGGFGQGPGEFMTPGAFDVWNSQVIARDIFNGRIQFLNSKGEYQRSFKIFRDYWSLAATDDLIYALRIYYRAPPDDQDSHLIDAMDFEGQVVNSFGELIDVNPYDLMSLLRAGIAVSPEKELWVAFHHLPVIRKYSMGGELLAEYRYSYGIADRKEAFNRQMMNERTKFNQVPYYDIVTAMFISKRGLYLIGSSPKRVDILLFKEGRIAEFYWLPINQEHGCYGLYVLEEQTGPTFFALDRDSHRIEVYKRKEGP